VDELLGRRRGDGRRGQGGRQGRPRVLPEECGHNNNNSTSTSTSTRCLAARPVAASTRYPITRVTTAMENCPLAWYAGRCVVRRYVWVPGRARAPMPTTSSLLLLLCLFLLLLHPPLLPDRPSLLYCSQLFPGVPLFLVRLLSVA